jgi:hypothetical protein
VAWKDWRLWGFALVAGLLQTGGILDVFFAGWQSARIDAQTLFFETWKNWIPSSAISTAGFAQSMLYLGILVLGVLGLSVVAQGALAFGLGTTVRGRKPTLQECLTVGARAFWPVAALNVVTLGLLWLARFLLLLPLAFSLSAPSVLTILASLLATALYLAALIALTAIHLFALNAIILEDASVWEGFVRAYRLFRSHAVVVIETGLLLFAISALIMIFTAFLFLVAGIPLFLLLIAAAFLQFNALVSFGFFIGYVLLLCLILAAAAFTVTYQFATWGRLYGRMHEGGVSAKFHRFLHWLLGAKRVKREA